MFLNRKNRQILFRPSIYLLLFFTMTGLMFLGRSSQIGLGRNFTSRCHNDSFWLSLREMYNTSTEDQTIRQARLQVVCSALEMPAKRPRKVFLYNQSIVFTRVNKCATTYTLGTLKKLTCGTCVLEKDSNKNHSGLSRSPLPELQHCINSHFSFFFVREPYGRLFSTFSNKFYMPKEHWDTIGPQIIQKYRKNPSAISLKYGHDVTFLEMIQYTVDTHHRGEQLDVHMTPMHKLARPCGVNYTYIGKLETLHADWENMLVQWKASGIVNQNVSLSDNRIFDRKQYGEINHLYRTIKIMKPSNVPLYNMFLRTWTYYQIAGQISKHIAMPYDKNTFKYIKKLEFIRAIQAAIDKSTIHREETKSQKMVAMMQAYATIPGELLERLRHVVLTDCRMFGYDDRPEWLFNNNKTIIDEHQYFKWD